MEGEKKNLIILLKYDLKLFQQLLEQFLKNDKDSVYKWMDKHLVDYNKIKENNLLYTFTTLFDPCNINISVNTIALK